MDSRHEKVKKESNEKRMDTRLEGQRLLIPPQLIPTLDPNAKDNDTNNNHMSRLDPGLVMTRL